MKSILLSRPIATDPYLPDFDAAEGWIHLPEEYDSPYILINNPFESSKTKKNRPVLTLMFFYKEGPKAAEKKRKGV